MLVILPLLGIPGLLPVFGTREAGQLKFDKDLTVASTRT